MSEFDIDGFFGGAPSFSFKDPSWRGKPRGGFITEPPRKEQQRNFDTGELEFWDKEQRQPKEHIVVTIDTTKGKYPELDPSKPGDDGIRRLFIKGQMVEAVRIAFKKAGAKGIRQGGELYVAWTSEEKAKNTKLNDKKIYTGQYTPPVAGSETDSVFEQAASAPVTPTPAQSVPVAHTSPNPSVVAGQPADPWGSTAPAPAPTAAPNPFA